MVYPGVADAGRSWLEAGRPEQAIPLLDDGLRLFGHSQPRNRLLHGVSLAQAMLLTRQPDGAVQATDQALALTAGQDSGRVRTRLAELRTALAASTASQAIEAADRVAAASTRSLVALEGTHRGHEETPFMWLATNVPLASLTTLRPRWPRPGSGRPRRPWRLSRTRRRRRSRGECAKGHRGRQQPPGCR
ncbi:MULTISPECIES: tetratricopeptide repeat protein [unclassified Frankia]|uniref:tetratricopeptide repeat protein n=1 Tax=unclassified Frankia TaxID=2632575 RepID=UPI002024C0ED